MRPIRGKVPSLHATPSGCVFESRCDRARDRCRTEHPEISKPLTHWARCFYADSPDPAELEALRAGPADTRVSPIGDAPVLKIDGLRTYYKAKDQGLAGIAGRHKQGFVKAVDNVSLDLGRNSTLGIVGESGCGKTTIAKCVAGLVPPNAGKLDFIGIDIAKVVEQRPVEMLKELQMIFQNPDSTLNPKRHSRRSNRTSVAALRNRPAVRNQERGSASP